MSGPDVLAMATTPSPCVRFRRVQPGLGVERRERVPLPCHAVLDPKIGARPSAHHVYAGAGPFAERPAAFEEEARTLLHELADDGSLPQEARSTALPARRRAVSAGSGSSRPLTHDG